MEPMHFADKLVYTGITLYALAIFTGIIVQRLLPYEHAKRVEWWTDLLAAIPITVLTCGMLIFPVVAILACLYMMWFGTVKS